MPTVGRALAGSLARIADSARSISVVIFMGFAHDTARWAVQFVDRTDSLRSSDHLEHQRSRGRRLGADGVGSAHLLEHARGGDRLLAPARRGEPGQVLAELDAFAQL